jgi:hypothetical protein
MMLPLWNMSIFHSLVFSVWKASRLIAKRNYWLILVNIALSWFRSK